VTGNQIDPTSAGTTKPIASTAGHGTQAGAVEQAASKNKISRNRKSSRVAASWNNLLVKDVNQPNGPKGERFAVVLFVLLGDMHDQRAEALLADKATHPPAVAKRQHRLPAFQASQPGYQFGVAKAALTGADLFHIFQDRGETPLDFIGSPVAKGDVFHVAMPVAPKPTGQTIALFDRGRIDRGAARGLGPRVGRSSHGCETWCASLEPLEV